MGRELDEEDRELLCTVFEVSWESVFIQNEDFFKKKNKQEVIKEEVIIEQIQEN